MYKKILVPLDGSELAERVLPYVKAVVKDKEGVSVTFIYSIQPVDSPLVDKKFKARIEADAKEAAEKYLENLIRKLDYRESAVCHILTGNAAERIIDYAADKKMNLIIMSTHGTSGLTRFRHGNIADKVMHGVNIPVWLIKSEHQIRTLVKEGKKIKVLVTLDGSKLSEEAIKHATGLATQLGKENVDLHLFRVCELFPQDERHHERTPRNIEEYMSEEQKRIKEVCSLYLGKIQNRLAKEGFSVKSSTDEGIQAETIISAANDLKVDFIVMSTHGRTGFSRWAFGSIAEKVIRGAECPVFIVRNVEKKE
jgi:nucleotide-binding universal stress UspA family protein